MVLRKVSLYMLLAVFAVFLILVSMLMSVHLADQIASQNEGVAVAHHMAPVDYNLTVGSLNEEMVHNGLEVGNLEQMSMLEMGQGAQNQATDPWMP